MISCMGGFKCQHRDSCRYYVTEHREHPVERLCEQGKRDAWAPIEVVRQAKEAA